MSDDEGRYAEYHIGWQEGYAEAAAENEKLRAALKPFAEQYDAVEKEFGLLMLPDDANSIVRYGDLRAAAAALKETG